MGDSISNDACFPGARAGENQHRTAGSLNSLTLLRIEL
jgi:hypothetical protein